MYDSSSIIHLDTSLLYHQWNRESLERVFGFDAGPT